MLKKGKSINPISHSRTAKFLHYTMFFNGLDILFVALLLCPSRLFSKMKVSCIQYNCVDCKSYLNIINVCSN